MPHRATVVLGLGMQPRIPKGASRSERISELKRAAIEARTIVVRWIRNFDSEAEVWPDFDAEDFQQSLPLLYVTATHDVLSRLSAKETRPAEVETVESPEGFDVQG